MPQLETDRAAYQAEREAEAARTAELEAKICDAEAQIAAMQARTQEINEQIAALKELLR